jgi:hypothetical protein
MSEREIETIVHILERIGADEATLSEAQRAADRAASAIGPLPLDPVRKQELLDLLGLMVDRTV